MDKQRFYPIFQDIEQLSNQQKPASSEISVNDFDAIKRFLLSYTNSTATFNAYRSEVEKFSQWLLLTNSADSLLLISPDHIKLYLTFLQNVPKEWVQTKRCKKFIFDNEQGEWNPNPEWRPFVKVTQGKRSTRVELPSALAATHSASAKKASGMALSKSSIASSLRVLSTLFEFLVGEEYLAKNPVKRLRQKRQLIGQPNAQAPVRRLSNLQWSYAISVAANKADEAEPTHRLTAERNLFILTVLYGLYLRISELAESDRWTPQMNHFFRDSDNHWWFKTVGKGNKERDISVSHAIIKSLKRYRTALGLPSLPTNGDTSPLIPSLGKKQSGLTAIRSTRQIRRLVQSMFDDAYNAMQRDGLTEDAEALKVATVHWLRHTGISDDVKHRPREHVRDDAGHSSSITTDRYIDVERRERHLSGQKKSIDVVVSGSALSSPDLD